MRTVSRLLLLLLAALAGSCSEDAPAEEYVDASSAIDAAQDAMNQGAYSTAAQAYAQARALTKKPSLAVQLGLEQCLAHVGEKAESEALHLLVELAAASSELLRPEDLGDLAHRCSQRGALCSARVAELCLNIAHEEFSEQQLAVMQPEQIAARIQQLGTIDLRGLASLGYVELDRDPPVSSPDSRSTMQE